MSIFDPSLTSATSSIVVEAPAADNMAQASTPMSMSFLLNGPTPPVGKEPQGTFPPSAPISSAPATASATTGNAAATEMTDLDKLANGAASPAPSTGHAPSGGDVIMVEATEAVETKTDNGEANSNGTAVEHFKCMNDEFEDCRTGQTTMDLSRKVISDHFGRNKACTRLIKDWPLFCRKHYQRATYNQKLWQSRKTTLILRQFNIIEEQFPGTKYTVALKKSEEQRLNTFARLLSSGKSEEEAATAVEPEKGKHFEAPINVLREIEQLTYLGEDKTKSEVEEAVGTINAMLEDETTDQVPSIEFLPQLNADGKPFDAKDRVKSAKKATTSRVSKKGGVAKPTPTKKTPKKA